MFDFDKSDLQRIAVSSIGAIALTTACLVGVAGPARAATPNAPLTVAAWQDAVERQIDAPGDAYALGYVQNAPAAAELAVRFTADGDYAGATVSRSSGIAALDLYSLRIAGKVAYPALPMGFRGQPQTVTMRLVYGVASDSIEAEAMLKSQTRTVQFAAANPGADTGAGIKIAAK